MTLTAPVGAADVARRLTNILADGSRGTLELRAYAPRGVPAKVAAVDGSSVTLAESGSHLIGAHRSGRVTLVRGVAERAVARPASLVLLDAPDASAALRDALLAAGLDAPEPPRLSPSACLDALRTLAEQREALAAVDELGAGDMLLLDGALQARPAAPFLDTLVARATERHVDLVGVCKSTSLSVGATPALAAARLAARGRPGADWYAELAPPASVRGRVVVARLSPAEPRPFRFDISAADGDVARVLGGLASLAGHPAYPGYPSPLAMAHNAAIINEDERLRLLAGVRDACLRAGVALDDWEAAFADYHDVLHLGA